MVQGVLLHSNVFSDFAPASHTFSRVGIGPTLCLRGVRTLSKMLVILYRTLRVNVKTISFLLRLKLVRHINVTGLPAKTWGITPVSVQFQFQRFDQRQRVFRLLVRS